MWGKRFIIYTLVLSSPLFRVPLFRESSVLRVHARAKNGRLIALNRNISPVTVVPLLSFTPPAIGLCAIVGVIWIT